MSAREQALARLRETVSQGAPLLGVGAGTGISAKFAEAGGADLIIIYNSGRYRMAGRGSLAGLLPYGDANQIVVEMAAEVLPIVRQTPVLAGVCGTDPFRRMEVFLPQLQQLGFAGVQNFPTVGLFEGTFRQNLEETGMGYGLEVEMIRLARKLELLTCPYVFNEQEARLMAEAGADVLVAHMGLTTKGTIGAHTALSLEQAALRVQAIRDAGTGDQSGCSRDLPRRPHRGARGCPIYSQAHARRAWIFWRIQHRAPGSRAGHYGTDSRLQANEVNMKTFVEPRHVETQVFDWGRIQWLSEPRVTGARAITAGVVTLEPGKGHQRHNHPGVEEVLYVLEGEGMQMVDLGVEERRTVRAGTMIHIPADIYHETINTGDRPMKLLAVYSPPGPEALLRSLPGCRIEPPSES